MTGVSSLWLQSLFIFLPYHSRKTSCLGKPKSPCLGPPPPCRDRVPTRVVSCFNLLLLPWRQRNVWDSRAELVWIYLPSHDREDGRLHWTCVPPPYLVAWHLPLKSDSWCHGDDLLSISQHSPIVTLLPRSLFRVGNLARHSDHDLTMLIRPLCWHD